MILARARSAARRRFQRRADEHAQTPMIGRSHGIHAEPITLGRRLRRHFAECARATGAPGRARATRSPSARSPAPSAPTPTSPRDRERGAGARSACGPRPSPRRSSRAIATPSCFNALALIGAAIEHFAINVRHWQRTEVGEAEEAFGRARRARARCRTRITRPHARTCAAWRACCAATRVPALENVALWHERDISHSSVERMIAPDATATLDFMLDARRGAHRELVVYPERMRRTSSAPAAFRRARACCSRWCARAWRARRPTRSCSASAAAGARRGRRLPAPPRGRPRDGARLPRRRARRRFDLEHPLRHADAIIDRALARRSRGDTMIARRHPARAARAAPSTAPTSRRSARSYEGKVRDNYTKDGQRILVVTDRISAFDVVLGTIPFKGQVLNQLAAYWFERDQGDRAQPRARRARPERDVARSSASRCRSRWSCARYLTGVTSTSIWRTTRRARASFCGHTLPDGMKKNQRAAASRSSRRAPRRRRATTTSQRLARGARSRAALSTRATFDAAAECARALFALRPEARAPSAASSSSTPSTSSAARRRARSCFIDEIHTPDSLALLVRRRLRGAPRRAARSRARSTRSTCAAGTSTRATRATARRRRSPTTCASRRPALHRGLRAGHRPRLRARHRGAASRASAATWELAGHEMTKIYVTLKRGVLDPQGQAVRARARAPRLRRGQGRAHRQVHRAAARRRRRRERRSALEEMCEKLLANTVIEEYRGRRW